MLKWLIGLVCTLFVFNLSIFAQQNTPPIVYRIVNRDVWPMFDGNLSVINGLTGIEIQQISLDGKAGDDIQLSKDKTKAFVTRALPGFNGGNLGLLVVDLQQGIVRTILSTFAVINVKLAPDGLVWTILGDNDMVAIIDPQTFRTINTINIANPRDVAFGPDGRLAYISSDGLISVYDIQTRRVIATVNKNCYYHRC